MNEEVKDLIRVHHVLLLTNFLIFVLITFATWDILWWWGIGDWDVGDRLFFIFLIAIANGFTCGAYYDWKHTREKAKAKNK